MALENKIKREQKKRRPFSILECQQQLKAAEPTWNSIKKRGSQVWPSGHKPNFGFDASDWESDIVSESSIFYHSEPHSGPAILTRNESRTETEDKADESTWAAIENHFTYLIWLIMYKLLFFSVT